MSGPGPAPVALLRRYAAGFGGRRQLLTWAAVAAVVRVATLVPIPLLVERTLSRAQAGVAGLELLLPGLAVLLLQAAGGVAQVWSRTRIQAAVREVTEGLRDAGLRKLTSLGLDRADALGSADLHDRVVHETERIDAAGRVLLADLLPGLAASAGLALALAAVDPRLLLLLAGLAPLFFASHHYLAPALRAAVAARNHAYQAFSRSVLHGLRAASLARAQGAGEWLLARQRGELHALTRATGRALELGEWSRSLQQALASVASVLALLSGAFWVARGELGIEELVGFFAGLALLRGPASSVLASAPPVAEAFASLAAVYGLLDEPDAPADGTDRLSAFDGRVELRDVSFAYGERRVLEGIELTTAPGHCVAVVGAIGAGKSTLLRLLLGLQRPSQGVATACGRDYASLDLVALRHAIGYVPQDPVLVPGSLRDNIAFGRPEARDESVVEAARLAGLEWAADLAAGVEAQIGEEGTRLSGGQRQQVALARALVGRPALLLLDEPTNHLSESAARALMARLRALEWRPAIVLVSHDPAVAAHADVVHRLEAGRFAR